MATYLNGVTDYIPQIQPFKPDFNFFQAALEKKQLQYEAGYEKINNVYSQLLNSPLLRQANEDRRNKLFNEIDNEIKRLSGVDLSLAENVQQAGKLFTPLINDQYFRADLAFTKQYKNQLSRADNLRKNPDPKSDERYWEEGVSALHYLASDFSKSTDDESLRFAAPRYTPFINTAKKLWDFAKEHNINPPSYEFKDGFIWTYKNGSAAIPTLQNVFSTVLNEDSRVKDMFQTQAYLNRKQYAEENAANFGGDTNLAEQNYLKEKIDIINNYYRNANQIDEEKFTVANSKKQLIEKRIAEEGIDPNLEKDLVALYQNSINDVSIQQSVLDKNNSVLNTTDFIKYDPGNLEGMRQAVDGVFATFLMDGMSNKIATDYATSKFEFKIEDNPYVKMKVQHAYDMAKIKQQFDNAVVLKLMEIAKAKSENDGDGIPGYTPDPFYDDGIDIYTPGAGGTVSEDLNILSQNARVQQSTSNTIANASTESIKEFLSYQNSILTNPTSSAEEKMQADAAVKTVLGEYTVVEADKESSFTKDAPTDFSSVIEGLFNLGTLSSPEFQARGLSQIWQGLFGDETVTVPGKVTKSTGYAVKGPDGTYSLVGDLSLVPGHDVSGSANYIGNVQKKITDYANQNLTISKDANAQGFKLIIDQYQGIVDQKQKLTDALTQASIENNKKINSLLTKESGIDRSSSGLFFNERQTAPRTENEFVAAYIKANKDNVSKYPKEYLPSSSQAYKYLPVSEEDRNEDMVEDAIDVYGKLKNTYERLSKTSELGLTSYTDKLPNEEGINRYFTQSKVFGFDAARYEQKGFKIGVDFFYKDLLPNIASSTTAAQTNTKVIAGVSGLDVTAKDYETLEHDSRAALLLKTFLASAVMNHGGKTGENQSRPTGTFTLSAVAANDANKVAMTWDISPTWIKEHAGTADNPGPAFEMQKDIAEGKGTNQITFFMDADKVKSAGFLAMQSTDQEMLLNINGSLRIDAFSDYGGNLEIRKNTDNTLSYWGVAKGMNERGQFVEEPISGTTSGDVNGLYNYWSSTLAGFSRDNMAYKNSLITNSNNKIYDRNALGQQ